MHPHSNLHSSNDESQHPPQTTSQYVAISTPKWQPNSKRGTRQILRRSDIPRDMWKYYIKPPKTWKQKDRDGKGLHNGVKSILMMNSFQTVILWWMQNREYFARTMSLDRLVDSKLKFTSAIRALEELDRFTSKVKPNNHLDSEYKQEQASMLYKNLQTASEKLHTATNTVNTFGWFGPLDENFQGYINDFVMDIEYHSEELYDYITDYVEDTTPPTSPL